MYQQKGRAVSDDEIRKEVWPERETDADGIPLVGDEEITILVSSLKKRLDGYQNIIYQVLKSIQGGMGIVYLCFDLGCKAPVAIKTILPEFFGESDSFEKFRQEALTWIELGKHRNIVNALYLEDVNNQPAVVMECISGDENYGNDLSCSTVLTGL